MKYTAVMTALTIVPALVGGLMGMNLIGNLWPVSLIQVVALVAVVMAFLGWTYYRLGWFKS
jgi:hypothetical protein